jgi:hypothetical protein
LGGKANNIGGEKLTGVIPPEFYGVRLESFLGKMHKEISNEDTDGVGRAIPATNTSVGHVAAGLEVSFPFTVNTAGLAATLGFRNIWIHSLTGGSNEMEGYRHKISAGIRTIQDFASKILRIRFCA